MADRLINEHDESQEHDLQEELYLVQRGRATFELDGERVDAPAGTLVFVRPEVKRTAFAEEPGTTLVAVGGTPGKAYEAQGGEIWMPLNYLYESGEYAEAADRGRELIEAHPEYAGPLYNLACCESLAGRTHDAIRHLRLAIDRKESFRSLAAGDSDFDPIRDEAAFKELVRATQPSQLRGNGLAPVASGDTPAHWPKRASHGWQLAVSVEDRFDVVPVRVNDERCVIPGVVMQSEDPAIRCRGRRLRQQRGGTCQRLLDPLRRRPHERERPGVPLPRSRNLHRPRWRAQAPERSPLPPLRTDRGPARRNCGRRRTSRTRRAK